jgi:hypothetical protein
MGMMGAQPQPEGMGMGGGMGGMRRVRALHRCCL